jgi:GR25 family glycosyltransferase involved in LPS biosynthesis
MNNPFNFFDGILCINLDDRTDRWNAIQEQFRQVGILERAERFPARKGDDGLCGCVRSHVGACKLALQRGWKRPLIFEDDAMFLEGCHEGLARATKDLESREWDMFFLGIFGGVFEHETDDLTRVRGDGRGSHAYCINPRLFQDLFDYYPTIDTQCTSRLGRPVAIDVYYADQPQRWGVCYAANPIVSIARDSLSSTEENKGWSLNMEQFCRDNYNISAKQHGRKLISPVCTHPIHSRASP